MTAAEIVRFQKVFDDVWNQLHRLQTHYTLYFCFFGAERSVELLRATAWVTFGALQELLIAAIYLETHRLLENASTQRNRRSASVERLIQDLPDSSAPLRRRLKRELKAARADCRSLSEWRDRHVAHRDAATVLGERIPALPPVKGASVGRTIEFVGGALTSISAELDLNHEYNVHREMDDLDVHKLLDRLQAAERLALNP
jgi:hypothetical protein